MAHRSSADPELSAIRTDIMEQGWALACGGSFQYTVGLTRYDGHPELLVTDACQHHGTGFLTALAQGVTRGHRFEAGQVVELTHEDDQKHVLTTFVPVHAPQRWILLADQLYRVPGGPPVPALQVVWQNEDGWPWESSEEDAEHLLGPPPSWAA